MEDLSELAEKLRNKIAMLPDFVRWRKWKPGL